MATATEIETNEKTQILLRLQLSSCSLCYGWPCTQAQDQCLSFGVLNSNTDLSKYRGKNSILYFATSFDKTFPNMGIPENYKFKKMTFSKAKIFHKRWQFIKNNIS